MATGNKLTYLRWLGGPILISIIGGITLMAYVDEVWALWGGIGLLILAAILVVAFLIILLRKRGEVFVNKDSDQANIIRDSKFKAKVKRADKATVMDINSPTQLENVEAKLEAQDVKDAAVIRTNQTMNITMGECSNCHKPLPSVSFGAKPSTIKCKFCGHLNKINED